MPPFPTLAHLAIWNRSLLQRRGPDDDDGGLLAYIEPRPDAAEPPTKRARQIGLAQGLVDFVRMLDREGSGAQLRVVHSAKRRIAFVEIEDGFWAHASIDLGVGASDSTPDASLDDECLVLGLRHGFDEFKLLHGSLAALHRDRGREAMVEALETFFGGWVRRWDVAHMTFGAGDLASQLGTVPMSPHAHLVASLASLPAVLEHHPSVIPFLIHRNALLYLPSAPKSDGPAPPMTAADIATLARHLLVLLRIAETTPPRAKRKSRRRRGKVDEAVAPAVDATPTSASKWTLGLSSYLAIPSFGLGASPPTAARPEKARRSVSWAKAPQVEVDPAQLDVGALEEAIGSDDDSDASSIMAEHIARIAIRSNGVAATVEPESTDVPGPAADVPAPTAPAPVVEAFSGPLRIHVGPSLDPAEVTWIRRGDLTLALVRAVAAEPDAGSKLATAAQVVLKEVELLLADAVLPEPSSVHRHLAIDPSSLASHSHGWPARDETWSGDQREADVSAAIWDARRGFDSSPRVTEAMIRTATSQWAVCSRVHAGGEDVVLVLPRRFGKDGGLIDAAYELDKLRRARVAASD